MVRILAIAVGMAILPSHASAYSIESASASTATISNPAPPENVMKWEVPSALAVPESAGLETLLETPAPAVTLAQTTEAEGAMILTSSEPLSVDLDTQDGTVLRTRFEAVTSDAPSVRVFVGKSDAPAATDYEDPHYAGTIAFYPVPLDGTFTSTLNIASLLERTGQSGMVTVTYVVDTATDGASVEISAIDLIPAP